METRGHREDTEELERERLRAGIYRQKDTDKNLRKGD